MNDQTRLETPGATSDAAYSSVRQPPARRIRIIQVLACVALAVSGYLLYQSITGDAVVGCGASSSCESVLTSRWSTVAGLPTPVLGAAVYLAVLITTFFLGKHVDFSVRLLGWKILALLTATAVLAAIWFFFIEAFVLHQFCMYCNAEHLLGVAIAAVVWTALPVGTRVLPGGRRDPLRFSWASACRLIVLSLLAVGSMIAAQILFNPPSESRIVVSEGHPSPVPSFQPEPAAPGAVILGNDVKFDVDLKAWPMLGPSNAPHVVIEMADYTCPHCRALMPQIEQVRQRYPGQIALVILPIPLNSDCNPAVTQTNPIHLDDCYLAKIALAVFRADPGKFELMHHWMLDRSESPSIAATRLHAEGLVGEEPLRRALADPWVQEVLKKSVQYYLDTHSTSVPKLIFLDRTYSIEHAEQGEVFDMFEHEFRLKSATSAPSPGRAE